MMKPYFTKLKLHPKAVISITACLVVGVVGTAMFVTSKAATPTANIEAENGVLSGTANSLADVSASGGAAVVFGSSSSFVHPGIFDSRAQLDFVKAKIQANQTPWVTLYNKAKTENIVSATYTLSPVATLACPTNTETDCVNMNGSGAGAYLNALLWYYSGNRTYAQQAIRLLNGWSSTLISYSNDNGSYLNAAWQSETFTRAAEIIRYTFTPTGSEASLDVAGLQKMFTNVFLPKLGPDTNAMKSSNGNWDTSMTDGMMNIAIFNDDHALFATSLARWRARAPAYVYSISDNGGNGVPVAPPGGLANTDAKVKCFWLNSGYAGDSSCDTSNFHVADGQIQETCRDYNHVALGMAGLLDAAETAHIQGVDLYGEQRGRLVQGLEYNAGIMNNQAYPSDICSGAVPAVKNSNIITRPTYVAAYNNFANRLGVPMPATAVLVQRIEANNVYGGNNGPPMVYEALTHYLVP